jgi:hypothetical protein
MSAEPREYPIEDIFNALINAGAVLSARDGQLSIRAQKGSIPADVGRAAAKSKIALTVFCEIDCHVCGLDQFVQRGKVATLVYCWGCLEMRVRPAGSRDWTVVVYERAATCCQCGAFGRAYDGWCWGCLERRYRLVGATAQLEKVQATTAVAVNSPPESVPVAGSLPLSGPIAVEPQDTRARCATCGTARGYLRHDVVTLEWRCERHLERSAKGGRS